MNCFIKYNAISFISFSVNKYSFELSLDKLGIHSELSDLHLKSTIYLLNSFFSYSFANSDFVFPEYLMNFLNCNLFSICFTV